MRLISHRGNLNGPDPINENDPLHVLEVIRHGFDVEIDIRYINDQWFLGHDEPEYKIDFAEFILPNSDNLWIHAKNEDALAELNHRHMWDLHYFWHQTDKYALTSKSRLWVYPGEKLLKESVWVLPENTCDIKTDIDFMNFDGYAICSDYVRTIRDRFIGVDLW